MQVDCPSPSAPLCMQSMLMRPWRHAQSNTDVGLAEYHCPLEIDTYETGLLCCTNWCDRTGPHAKRAHPVLGTALMVRHILVPVPEHFFFCSEGLVELWKLIGFRGRVLHLLNQ